MPVGTMHDGVSALLVGGTAIGRLQLGGVAPAGETATIAAGKMADIAPTNEAATMSRKALWARWRLPLPPRESGRYRVGPCGLCVIAPQTLKELEPRITVKLQETVRRPG
jgi:hypothetical protein